MMSNVRDERSYDGDSEPTLRRRQRSQETTTMPPPPPQEPQVVTTCIQDIVVVRAAAGEDDDDELSVLSGGGDTVRLSSEHAVTVPRVGAHTSIALKMAAMQASFAEKTAHEMKQIVDWYSENNEEDRFVKVKQSLSLPDNAMACLDEGDDESQTGDASLKHDNGKCDDGKLSESADVVRLERPGPTPRSASPLHVETDISTHTGSTSEASIASTMAASPMSLDSPLATFLGDFINEELQECETYNSRKVAAEQSHQIQILLNATKFMEDVVLEYEQSSSSSDVDKSPRTTIVTRKISSPSPSRTTTPMSRRTKSIPSQPKRTRKRRIKKSIRVALHVVAILILVAVCGYSVCVWRQARSVPLMMLSSGHLAPLLKSIPVRQCQACTREQCGLHPDECDMEALQVAKTRILAHPSRMSSFDKKRKKFWNRL
jgi:hypothetical protein